MSQLRQKDDLKIVTFATALPPRLSSTAKKTQFGETFDIEVLTNLCILNLLNNHTAFTFRLPQACFHQALSTRNEHNELKRTDRRHLSVGPCYVTAGTKSRYLRSRADIVIKTKLVIFHLTNCFLRRVALIAMKLTKKSSRSLCV